MKQRKETLTEELRQAMKNSRKESEIMTIQSQVTGLKTRLKYSQTDRETTKKKIVQLQKNVEKMKEEFEEFGPRIREVETSMEQRERQIDETKVEMNNVEDRIFGKFCKTIGVQNIRQYEERELKTQQDREKKKMEFDNQINRISNQLEYERKREDQLLANVQKFERTVQDDEDALETAKKIEQIQMSEIDEDMKEVDKLKQTKSYLKNQCDKFEDDVNSARRDVGTVAKELQSANKAINQLDAAVEQEKSDRHSLLKHCKLFSIKIPFKKGDFEDIGKYRLDHAAVQY